jgi:hypothetical protein
MANKQNEERLIVYVGQPRPLEQGLEVAANDVLSIERGRAVAD